MSTPSIQMVEHAKHAGSPTHLEDPVTEDGQEASELRCMEESSACVQKVLVGTGLDIVHHALE